MTLKQWNELKPGDFVRYTGRGYKKGTVCVLTGDDVEGYSDSNNGADIKGMAVLGREAVWDKDAPWRRMFRNGSYRNWSKVTCVVVQ